MSKWTDTEIDKLESLYPLLPPESLEKEFPDRSKNAIRSKANYLNLSKVDGYRRAYSVNRSDSIQLDELDESMSHFVCGLTAGEGYFILNDFHSENYRFGMGLHPKDNDILNELQDFFGCGTIDLDRKNGDSEYSQFRVVDLGDIVLRIIPFFDKYGLRNTHKQQQYNEWRKNVLDSLPQGCNIHKTTERP
jgi:hypothetical protein